MNKRAILLGALTVFVVAALATMQGTALFVAALIGAVGGLIVWTL